MSLWIANAAFAATHPYEFHADARMQHEKLGPIENAYGYTIVATDANGNGSINVMFSNGSSLDGARFNARVKFLDASGQVIKEENFGRWIAAADSQGAMESKVSKPLKFSNFARIEVEFYLSDIPKLRATASLDRHNLKFSQIID